MKILVIEDEVPLGRGAQGAAGLRQRHPPPPGPAGGRAGPGEHGPGSGCVHAHLRGEQRAAVRQGVRRDALPPPVPGQHSPKETILARVWGYDSNAVENHVKVYVGFLRKKLASIGSNIRIETVQRLGYRLEVDERR